MRSALRGLVLALILVATSVPHARAATPAPTAWPAATAAPDTLEARLAAVDAYLQEQQARYGMPALAVAVVQGDRIVHRRGFGTERPGGPAVTPDTPFVLASVSKSFTALAVMQLVEAGQLDLDAPVQRYLPWFRVADPAASARTTVRNLLTMQSGIPRDFGPLGLDTADPEGTTLEAFVRALKVVKLWAPPGEKYQYSNANYNILGLIVQTLSGEPYPQYIQRHILEPLAMSNSFVLDPTRPQPASALAVQTIDGHPSAVPIGLRAFMAPAGGVFTSAEDHAHYLIAQLNGGVYNGQRVLSPEGIAAMHTGGARINDRATYAMGWVVNTGGPTTTVSHNGGIRGHATFQQLLPEQGYGFVVLAALDVDGPRPDINAIGAGVRRLLLGEAPAA